MTDLKSPIEYGLPSKFKDYLPNQREAILSIVDQFRSGKHVVFLDGPTGSGKSICAIITSKLLAEQYPYDFSSLISVQTKALQDQYARDFSSLISVRGRGNFKCAEQPDLSVDEGLCTLPDYKCEDKFSVCPYYQQKAAAAKATSVVTNLAFYLAEINYTDGMVCSGRNLLVLDEGHLLENAIMSFVSVLLPERSLTAIGIDLPKLSEPDDAKRWATQIFPVVAREYATLAATVGNATRANGNVDVHDIRRLLRYKAMTRRLQTLQNIEPGKWFLAQTYAGYTLKPFLVDEFVQPLVTSHSPRVLMMSATFLSSRVMTKLLGLDAKTTGWHQMDSNFPVGRRPYNFIPVLKLNYKTGSVGYSRLTKVIDEILEKHPNEKGVVHTSSFKIMNQILRFTKYPGRFLSHKPSSSQEQGKPTRDEAIGKFMKTREPRVLISPSVGLGLDLHDDLARFQVLAKVPFGSLGDPQIKYRLSVDQEWYSWCAVAAIVQACFSEDTELLTGIGWKKPQDIKVGDTIFGLEPKLFEGTKFGVSTNLIPHLVEGQVLEIQKRFTTSLLNIKAKSLDALVTPDHDMIIIPNRFKQRAKFYTPRADWDKVIGLSYGLQKVQASTLTEEPCCRIPLAGLIKGRRVLKVRKPREEGRKNVAKLWLKLVGIILTDGSFIKRGNNVVICQGKPGNVKIIKQLLQDLSLSFRERTVAKAGSICEIHGSSYIRNYDAVQFSITGLSALRIKEFFLRGKLRRYPKGISWTTKYPKISKANLPRWMLHRINRQDFYAFLDGLMLGDGTWQTEKSGVLYNSDKDLLDFVQSLMALFGIRSSLHQRPNGQYDLGFYKNPWVEIVPRNSVESIEFSEPQLVWDVTTDIGSILVRRKGKTFITGNCGRSTRHSKDWSTCYILDAAFWQLWKKHNGLFPKWWRDALHIIRSKSVSDAVIAEH